MAQNNNPFDVLENRLANIEALIHELHKKLVPDSKPVDQWFDLDELCKYHPDHPKKSTVYAWVNTNAIPFHKTGKKLRFLKSEIDAWLAQGYHKTYLDVAKSVDSYNQPRFIKRGKSPPV
ncbi:MAG: helix-turn-helix domain-containing protein [Chitinophagales bacterium]|jgi:excisionase family DNA binding protein|nr:helix-turn-helix domain-containing protein [Chitinophagales bacterium]